MVMILGLGTMLGKLVVYTEAHTLELIYKLL
nr:hypothetical protein [Gaetbulibacter sp. 4G1]